MIDSVTLRVILYRALFVALVLAHILFALMPLGAGAPRIPGPDILFCIIAAWMIRRPDFLPWPLVAGTMLLTDFLFLQPPGLWTLLVLIATEVLRGRARQEPDSRIQFHTEFGLVAGVFTAALMAKRAIYALFLLDQPPLGATLLHLMTTLATYPLVVAGCVYLLGVRRMTPDEANLLGMRI